MAEPLLKISKGAGGESPRQNIEASGCRDSLPSSHRICVVSIGICALPLSLRFLRSMRGLDFHGVGPLRVDRGCCNWRADGEKEFVTELVLR